MDELRLNGLCRQLGFLEQRLTARTLNGFYNNFCLIATYNKKLSSAVIFTTLRKMILNHSILSANYSLKTNEIQPIPEIIFKDVVTFEHRELHHIEPLLYEIENCKFKLDSKEPLFKILIINENVLVVIFDHSFTDGGSGKNFHEIFLKLLNEVSEEEELLEVNDDSILFNLNQDMKQMAKLPLPVELVLDVLPDREFLVNKWVKSKLPNGLKIFFNDHDYNKIPSVDINGTSVSKWAGLQPSLNYKTLYKVVNISNDNSDKILKLARSHQMTVTPIIQVLLLQSFVISNVIQNEAESSYYINSSIAINLRRHIPQELQEASAIAARVYPGIHNNLCVSDLLKSRTDPNLFWKLCQECFDTISKTSADPKSVMNAYTGQSSIHDERSIEETKTALYDDYLKNDAVNAKFSNLGFFKNIPSAKYWVEDMVFSQSIGVNGGVTVLNAISTQDGGMNLCVTCLDGLFKKEQEFLDLCDLFKESILELLD